MINVDKNAAYPKATDTLQADDTLPKTTELRQNKYLGCVAKTSGSLVEVVFVLTVARPTHLVHETQAPL